MHEHDTHAGPPPYGAGKDAPSGGGPLIMFCLRVVFVVALCAVGWSLAAEQRSRAGSALGVNSDLVMIAFGAVALIFIALDVFIPRKSLTAISGVFFGLVVGLVVAYGLALIIDLVVEGNVRGNAELASIKPLVSAVKVAAGMICCYLSISFVLQTKDDVRFVIPYVEFAKQRKGARPLVLDTSVIIDGRIADIAETRIIDTEMIVPRFVLQELQLVADSADKLKRTRGRRGLDMLNKLQTNDKIEIKILDVVASKNNAPVDEMLVDLATELNGKVVTNDYNLNKVAQLRGVTVINVNDLANALKPVVLPGETMTVKMIKPGEELGQGIGYLDDGTMVVGEGGRDRLGQVVDLTVTSVLQTSAGRMIFGRLSGARVPERRPPRPPGRT
ncbi:MAG: PIN/TRAM domain-containing protein [Phycisphaerae bacterium]